MDVVLLLAQVVLVVLLVVIPLFSGYDKFKQWTPQRKAVAIALAVGIAVVAFGQYRRIVRLHQSSLESALANVGLYRGPWYARRIVVSFWEWLGTIFAGSVMAAFALDAARRRQWPRFAATAGLFALMVTLAALLKLGSWGE